MHCFCRTISQSLIFLSLSTALDLEQHTNHILITDLDSGKGFQKISGKQFYTIGFLVSGVSSQFLKGRSWQLSSCDYWRGSYGQPPPGLPNSEVVHHIRCLPCLSLGHSDESTTGQFREGSSQWNFLNLLLEVVQMSPQQISGKF